MSFYLRIIREIMNKMCIDKYNKVNKKQSDHAMQKVLDMDNAQCNQVWARIRELYIGKKALCAITKKAL